MARIAGIGFELNSTAANVEFTSVTGAGCTVVTTHPRSGTYEGRCTSLVSATRQGWLQDFTPGAAGPFYWRVALYVATLPSAENTIITMLNSVSISGTISQKITIDNTGVLRLYNQTTQVGSASSALSTGQYYVIQGWYDKSPGAGVSIMKATLNGVEFASATNLTAINVSAMALGANLNAEAQTTGDWFFDDYCVNDNGVGGTDTSYPDWKGKIVVVMPDAAGDNAAWTIGGSVPAATNFQGVDEAGAPNDGVDFNGSKTLNQADSHQISKPAAIASGDTINNIGLYWRWNGAGASANSTMRTQIKSAASGTVANGSTLAPANTTWLTGTLTRAAFRHVSYTDPTTGIAWTPTGTNSLDNAQIGYNISTASTNNAQVTAVGAVVDYTPVVAASYVPQMMMMGVG